MIPARSVWSLGFPFEVSCFIKYVADVSRASDQPFDPDFGKACPHVLSTAEVHPLDFARTVVFFSGCLSEAERRAGDPTAILRTIQNYADEHAIWEATMPRRTA